MVKILQRLLVRGALVADAHELIKQNRALLLRLDLVGLVFAHLVLQEVAHLGQL